MTRTWLSRHRWWLAALAVALSPWPGPHVDGWLPLGAVLARATGESPDAGFWIFALVAAFVGYAVWWAVLAAIGRWLAPGDERT